MYLILFHFKLHIFIFSSKNKINQLYTITSTPSFQNGFRNLFTSTGFYLKSKNIEDI